MSGLFWFGDGYTLYSAANNSPKIPTVNSPA